MKYPMLKKYGITCESKVGDINFALSKAEGVFTNTFHIKRQIWDADVELFHWIEETICNEDISEVTDNYEVFVQIRRTGVTSADSSQE